MSAFAVLGLFDDVDAFMAAIPTVRAKNVGALESYTPYPVHGLDEALGLRRSPLGGMVLVMGILGALAALAFQYWISAVDYPIVTGGKAPGSWEAFVPIMFEVMVLFATFTAGLGMLILLNRLPFFGHPVLDSRAMAGITRDRFALSVENPPDVQAAREALEAAGARDIEVLGPPATGAFLSADFILRVLGGIAAACLVAGLALYGAIKLFPVLPPMSHMQDQPRLSAQRSSPFFADGSGMRLPVEGTVARGHMPLGVASQDEANALPNPLPRSREVLGAGRGAYLDRCVFCHGALANGEASLSPAYGGKPANLQARQFLEATDGRLYWAITRGKNAMPAHEADLTEAQRWALVHYLRALQRAQNATDEDLR
jgi:mono/diheme cytochrome c family protein